MRYHSFTNVTVTRSWSKVAASVIAPLLLGCIDDTASIGNSPTTRSAIPITEPVDCNTKMSRDEIKSFKILSLPWYVKVSQNGSGSIGFGSTAGDVGMLSAGVLDFVKWQKQIVILEWHDSFHNLGPQATLTVWWPHGVEEVYFVDRDKIPIQLFQAAIDATTHERLRKIWSEKPLK